MTVSTTTNKIIYSGLIGQTVFAYNFRVDRKLDMNVLLDGVLIAQGDWTIDGIGEDVGGNVTLSTPLVADATVTLLREVDETQLVDYQPFDAFPAETHEGALDKLTMITQQMQEQLDRAPKLPIDTTLDNYDLGTPVANEVIMYNATEDGQTSTGIDATAFNANVQAAADSAAAAAASETLAQEWAENPEDDPVIDPDQFSAFHWAQKSEAFTNWEQYLDGYDAASRRHTAYAADLDDIIVDSKYYIDSTAVTNEPADFVGIGLIETDLWPADTTQAVQLLISMDVVNEGLSWIRQKESDAWSEWLPFGAGGSATTISATPPVDPDPGDSWWDSELGRAFVYYDDGDSSQWVEEDPGNNGGVAFTSVGAVTQFPNGAPLPWLLCDGQALSRTLYPDLFAYLGVVYGNGDGSTTFNVPDYRGRFLRGTSRGTGTDPDAGSRTDRGDGVTGDEVGTEQADAYKSHTHVAQRYSAVDARQSGGGGSYWAGEVGVNTGGSGGSETRPKNTNVDWYILSDVASVQIPGIAGTVVQVQNFQTGELATGANPIGIVDSPPPNTQGNLWMQLAFTPKYANSILKIDVVLQQNHASSGTLEASFICRDATVASIAAIYQTTPATVNYAVTFAYSHMEPANAAVETTFFVYGGHASAGTSTFNGSNGGRIFGGVMASSITITEIAQ